MVQILSNNIFGHLLLNCLVPHLWTDVSSRLVAELVSDQFSFLIIRRKKKTLQNTRIRDHRAKFPWNSWCLKCIVTHSLLIPMQKLEDLTPEEMAVTNHRDSTKPNTMIVKFRARDYTAEAKAHFLPRIPTDLHPFSSTSSLSTKVAILLFFFFCCEH